MPPPLSIFSSSILSPLSHGAGSNHSCMKSPPCPTRWLGRWNKIPMSAGKAASSYSIISFFYLMFILHVGVLLIYSFVLVLPMQQSAIRVCVYICIHTFFSDSFLIQIITECWSSITCVYSRSLLIIYFLYGSVYKSVYVNPTNS